MTKPATRGRKSDGTTSALDSNGIVGRKLRSYYDSIETEPLPEQLLDLLDKLDEAERKAKPT
ncbi:NepR family anti-sigma factor [Mycoplana rhizolycopersici]|uniref:Anti-sigma factor NepR domain-containing protein n=1 Tax=Mycoplana rhizolycopersici TaxID=2746702 RepID=A0ABX2QFB5_9HYPH|nr:NepR family anti-sigma factor [Rhizobium rhizolycopersici]NVP55051.1 hypothetical protein [Rhizobium rhizolycopersici]